MFFEGWKSPFLIFVFVCDEIFEKILKGFYKLECGPFDLVPPTGLKL